MCTFISLWYIPITPDNQTISIFYDLITNPESSDSKTLILYVCGENQLSYIAMNLTESWLFSQYGLSLKTQLIFNEFHCYGINKLATV